MIVEVKYVVEYFIFGLVEMVLFVFGFDEKVDFVCGGCFGVVFDGKEL